MNATATYRPSLDNRRSLHVSESRWFAVKTPYKREKTVQKELKMRGVECYVPLVKKVKKYERKIKSFEVPLINNYVFVKIKKQEYVSVLQTRDVVDFVRFDAQLSAIPEEEMQLLQRIVGETSDLEATSIRVYSGQEVEIINGKLTGIKGRVVEEKSRHLVLVDLETLGWSIQLEVHPKYLRLRR